MKITLWIYSKSSLFCSQVSFILGIILISDILVFVSSVFTIPNNLKLLLIRFIFLSWELRAFCAISIMSLNCSVDISLFFCHREVN